MRKISKAQEQHTILNFRTASDRDWVDKNHADVMKNGFNCDACGKKFPPGTDFDDIMGNGGANEEAGRSCSTECQEKLAEIQRDAEDGASTANAEWNYSRRASVKTPNDITTRGFDASEGTDRGGHVDIVLPTHTCDIGNHEVKGDVTCAERYCMSRKRGEGTWDQHGHQNWSHNYACAEHMPEFGPRKGGPGPSLDHPEHVWKPEDTIASKTASDKPWAAGIAKSHDGKKKEASVSEALGLLTPAAIVAQPFIMDKINKHNDKKRKQKEPEEQKEPEDFDERYASEKTATKCKCGHDQNAHMWDTKMNPEAESQMEDLGCRECGSWTQTGDFNTDCKEFEPAKDFRGEHSNVNSDW